MRSFRERVRLSAAEPSNTDETVSHSSAGTCWKPPCCDRSPKAWHPGISSEKKLRDSIREKTPRTQGQSLPEIIKRVNASLRGWFEYFKHSSRQAFNAIDAYVRMRMRSILRKRSKRKGRGHGYDHFRWPNLYFQQMGLFSLAEHHHLYRQSLKSVH